MNKKVQQYIEFIKDYEKIQSKNYLKLLSNAAGKKAEAIKRIRANDAGIGLAMKDARRYLRIIDYILNKWDREMRRNKCGMPEKVIIYNNHHPVNLNIETTPFILQTI